MLVSHLHQFIYTKTSKTAGTSVEVYFEAFCKHAEDTNVLPVEAAYVSAAGIIGKRGKGAREAQWFNHMSAERIKAQLGGNTWKEYFKFCTIRNPFDKIISGFHFELPQFKQAGAEPDQMKEVFRNWVLGGKTFMDRDRYMIDNDVCVDYFIRYEDLEGGIQYVCEKLNVPFEPERLPRLKSNYRPAGYGYEAYYDSDTIAAIANAYQFEINKFGYEIPALAMAV